MKAANESIADRRVAVATLAGKVAQGGQTRGADQSCKEVRASKPRSMCKVHSSSRSMRRCTSAKIDAPQVHASKPRSMRKVRLEAKIDAQGAQLDAKIDAQCTRLDALQTQVEAGFAELEKGIAENTASLRDSIDSIRRRLCRHARKHRRTEARCGH